jgi:hypothetical protein
MKEWVDGELAEIISYPLVQIQCSGTLDLIPCLMKSSPFTVEIKKYELFFLQMYDGCSCFPCWGFLLGSDQR